MGTQDWGIFADWLMKAALGVICTYGVHVLSGMKKSIDELNKSVATVIERTEWHTNEIKRLDSRIDRVEAKV